MNEQMPPAVAGSVEPTVGHRFAKTYCSQCGGEFGPGDAGFSHCSDHASECQEPPRGWRCTRMAGHDGPCAAVACHEEVAIVERGMQRLRYAGYFGSTEAPKEDA